MPIKKLDYKRNKKKKGSWILWYDGQKIVRRKVNSQGLGPLLRFLLGAENQALRRAEMLLVTPKCPQMDPDHVDLLSCGTFPNTIYTSFLSLVRQNLYTIFNIPFKNIQLSILQYFIELDNHHLYLISEHFHHLEKEVCTHQQLFPILLLFPQPLETINLLFISMNFPILDISYKWTHDKLPFVTGFFYHKYLITTEFSLKKYFQKRCFFFGNLIKTS